MFSTENQSIERTIDLISLDNQFANLIDIPYWQGECMAINNQNVLLLPYRALENNISVPTPYFVLAKITPPQSDDKELKVESIKLIQENFLTGKSTVNKVQSFFDSFFVVIGSWTYRIDIEGHIELSIKKVLNIFQHNGELLAFAPNNNSGLVGFYKSVDQGKTWISLGEIDQISLLDLQYVEIDTKLVGYGKGQLFEINLNENNYSIKELGNDGLSLADITSITLSNDDMVLVTTHCNSFSDTCGGYYKPLDSFFDLKVNK